MTDDTKYITVTIKTPEKTLFDGTVHALSTKNVDGPLDILPLHENFISIIQEIVIIHTEGEADKTFPVDKGILLASSNTVAIFLGISALTQISQQNSTNEKSSQPQ